MRRLFIVTPGVLAMLAGANAQEATPTATFEAAEISITKDAKQQPHGEFKNSRVAAFNATLRMLIHTAWEISDDRRLVAAPAWFDKDRFDVLAKAPPDTPDTTLRLMLQNLLIERFKMVVHKEDRAIEVYLLTIKKGGPILQPAAAGNRTACLSRSVGDGMAHRDCQNVTMSDLARMLPGMANAYIDLPVVDSTGLKRAYDFSLTWAPRNKLL